MFQAAHSLAPNSNLILKTFVPDFSHFFFFFLLLCFLSKEIKTQR